jgi:hypothetical protein
MASVSDLVAINIFDADELQRPWHLASFTSFVSGAGRLRGRRRRLVRAEQTKSSVEQTARQSSSASSLTRQCRCVGRNIVQRRLRACRALCTLLKAVWIEVGAGGFGAGDILEKLPLNYPFWCIFFLGMLVRLAA